MSNEVKNSADNSELIEYLKVRKEAQTEIEIKNIMSKIYKTIATNSKLFYAFSSSILPRKNDKGDEEFEVNSIIKPALIYSEKAEPYLPVYTTLEESQNRGTIEQYPYVKSLDFGELSEMVLDESKKIEGIVINPFSDNLILNKSKVQYLLNLRKENNSKVEEVSQNASKIVGKVAVSTTSGVYTKNATQKKNGILVNEYDLRILEYNVLPSRVVKVAINFAKENPAITALWVFDKRYYLPNDNTQYMGQLVVVEDTLENEEEREKIYSALKSVVLSQSNASEVFIETINKQKKDFIRKNVILPFYQKVNVFGEYGKES